MCCGSYIPALCLPTILLLYAVAVLAPAASLMISVARNKPFAMALSTATSELGIAEYDNDVDYDEERSDVEGGGIPPHIE